MQISNKRDDTSFIILQINPSSNGSNIVANMYVSSRLNARKYLSWIKDFRRLKKNLNSDLFEKYPEIIYLYFTIRPRQISTWNDDCLLDDTFRYHFSPKAIQINRVFFIFTMGDFFFVLASNFH